VNAQKYADVIIPRGKSNTVAIGMVGYFVFVMLFNLWTAGLIVQHVLVQLPEDAKKKPASTPKKRGP
jgi:hypothetical protein